jgi:hypothetical protein
VSSKNYIKKKLPALKLNLRKLKKSIFYFPTICNTYHCFCDLKIKIFQFSGRIRTNILTEENPSSSRLAELSSHLEASSRIQQ